MTQQVTVLGPNLTSAHSSKGTFHVHAAGCADIKKRYSANEQHGAANLDINSTRDVAEYFYFAPCLKDLPSEAPKAEAEIDFPEAVAEVPQPFD